MIIRYHRRHHHQHKKKRGLLAILADAFATIVIASSMLFLVYDSVYLLRRYLPALVHKINARRTIDLEEEDPLGVKSITVVKQVNDNPMDRDNDDK